MIRLVFLHGRLHGRCCYTACYEVGVVIRPFIRLVLLYQPNKYTSRKLGFSGENGEVCVKCTQGTYKNIKGDSHCTKCPLAIYSPSLRGNTSSVCRNCPENTGSPTGSQNLINCRCRPGFTATVDGVKDNTSRAPVLDNTSRVPAVYRQPYNRSNPAAQGKTLHAVQQVKPARNLLSLASLALSLPACPILVRPGGQGVADAVQRLS